jgi:hypothetical protein
MASVLPRFLSGVFPTFLFFFFRNRIFKMPYKSIFLNITTMFFVAHMFQGIKNFSNYLEGEGEGEGGWVIVCEGADDTFFFTLTLTPALTHPYPHHPLSPTLNKLCVCVCSNFISTIKSDEDGIDYRNITNIENDF